MKPVLQRLMKRGPTYDPAVSAALAPRARSHGPAPLPTWRARWQRLRQATLRGELLAVLGTVALVTVPLPALLPSLNDWAVLEWHVAATSDGVEYGHSGPVLTLLSLYVALLLFRYVAFLTASAID